MLSGDGGLLGDDVVCRRAGELGVQAARPVAHLLKRGRHAVRIIEIISPAGFEDCFREMAAIWPDLSKAGPILEK